MVTIAKTDLDDNLLKLGLLVGLLDEHSKTEVVIDTGWFEDPFDGIRNVTSGGNDRLFGLIEDIFPKDGVETAETETRGADWHAITYPDDKGESKKTPLNLVRKWEKDAEDQVTSDLIGLGFKSEYGNKTSVVVSPYLFVPVADRGQFVAGKSGHPIEAGVEIRRGEDASEHTFGTQAIRFQGVRLALKIHFDDAPEISDIMLFGLEGVELPGMVPGQTEVGLIELFGNAPEKLEEWLEFVFELVLTQTSGEDAGSLSTALTNVRHLLGLSKNAADEYKVPSINWGDFASQPDVALKQWFGKIFSDDAVRKVWLNAVQCLLDGKDGTDAENADAMSGNGTAAEPYVLSVLSSWSGSSFAVTFATDGGKLSVGLRLESETYELAHGIGVQFLAAVDAGQFGVSATNITTDGVLRAFDLNLRVCSPKATSRNPVPLFEYAPYPLLSPLPGEPERTPPPETALILGALQAGIHVRRLPDLEVPLPSLRFTGVTLGDDAFDVDLLKLKKRPAGTADPDAFADDFSKENVTRLLEVLGGALQNAWDRYQPSSYASLETNVERIVQGDDYRSIIEKLLTLSATDVSDIPALLVQLAEWIGETEPDDVPKLAFDWLIGGGNVFGLFGDLLSLKIPEFSGEGSLLSYNPWRDFSVSIGKETDRFGIWLRPRAELNAMSLSGEIDVTLDGDFTNAAVSAFSRIGLAESSLESLKRAGFDFNPELALRLGQNASGVSVEVYPLGSAAENAFLMALLPSPLQPPYLAYKNAPETAVPIGDWMLHLVPQVMLPVFEEKLLNDASVTAILEESPLDTDTDVQFTAATVLVKWGVLSVDYGGKYRLAELVNLSSLTAPGLFESIVTTFQESIGESDGDYELLTIDRDKGDGIYFVSRKGANEQYTDFGLRLQITDIAFGGKKRDLGTGSAGSKKATPTMQLGKWLSNPVEETSCANWIASGSELPVTIEPGLTVTFLRLDKENNATFKPGFELASVGVDIDGATGKPLFNNKGYRLQGLQSRLYFAWSEDDDDPKFGAAIQLQEMGIPLGPPAGGGSGGTNPVAANLLASDGGGKGQQEGAVNPTFSGVIAYVNKFHGEIFSDTPSADGKAWIPVSRNFGPLHCRQIGLGLETETDGPRLGVGYDGGVALGPLNIDLDHLTIDIPLKEPQNLSKYELGLAGLDISYAGGPVSISGGFFKIEDPAGLKPTQYDGMALIKAADFTVTGFGSYTVIGGDPSMFVFAILHKDLGGPSFFRITGLAAGFGYNRALRLPPIEEVQHFPLVAAALDEKYLAAGENAISSAMEILRDYIPPSRGEYWFAIGVRFSSFEMIESFALLSVSFGHEVEIGLLGMSKMTLPKGAKQKDAVAYAELTLRAVIKPEEGSIAVEARLTDKSFIFSKDCRLSGGFAFYIWCSGEHGGDFVLTLGGYHSKFVPPDHYPVVPRLGINWKVNPVLTITAEMYFALTPSCLMMGGNLRVVYQVPCIKAWFTAYADFLLSWQPFYYLVDMGIAIGVEASVRIPLGFVTITISIRVELSVELHLWGPPFAGEATVDLSVISFTIPFGDPKTAPTALTAQEFADEFLPSPALELTNGQPDVIGVRINSGLLYQREQDKQVLRVVNAHALSLTAESLVPSTRFDGLAVKAKYRQRGKRRPNLGTDFGIRPMARKRLNSRFEVLLQKEVDGIFVAQPTPANLRASFVENGVPDALWGPSEVEGQVALPGEPKAITIDATVGIRFTFAPFDPEHALFPIPLEKLKFEQLPTKTVVWQDLGEAPTIAAHGENTFWNTIWGNTAVDDRRNSILDILSRQSPFEMNTPNLERFRRAERDYFQSDPTFCTLGEQLK